MNTSHSDPGRLPRHVFAALFFCVISSQTGVSAQVSNQVGSGSVDPPLQSPAAETPGATPEPGDATPSALWTGGRYRITPSDVIELRFPYVPEFDQTVTVQPDGYISLRAAGDIRVQGRSLPELTAMLAEAYEGILHEPVINALLKEFERPYFFVAGEVMRPGKFELRGALTLTQALIVAGGQTHAAKLSEVVLFRQFTTEWLEVKQVDVKKMYSARNLSEDPLLRPGDTIFVPKSALSKIAPFIPRPSLGLYLNPFAAP